MKKILLSTILLVAIMFSFLAEGIAQNTREALSKDKINQIIDEHFQNSNAPFNWKTTDAYTIWSAAMRSDQMLAIGYQPVGMNRTDFKRDIGNFNFNASEWENIRQDIVETTVADIAARNPTGRTERTHLLPFGEKNQLPYFYIRVYDLETVEALMAREDIRFVEPSGYVVTEEDEGKSGVGCGEYADASINPADLVTITDNGITAVRSWHHDNHNIPCAWANGWRGQGIEIAVMDSGVSDYHPQFGANFTSGNSSVRTMNKVNFYDGITGDDCGHGSSMSGLAAGPYNSTTPSMPVGIAYQADFNAYRVAPNVLLETSAEQNAVANAYIAAADDPDIKITSMSLGYVFSSGVMETAILYAYSKDLMMFCAAGTSDYLLRWYPVIFPAWMPETIAITGVNDAAIGSRDACRTCHDGAEVDFVTVMERASDFNRKAVSLGNPPGPGQDLTMGYVGGSSAGTASMAGMAAVIWSANPGETRSQIYNRMAQSADYYPGRDDDFGWGVVDVCKAADPNFAAPCDPTLANSSVTLEITNIVYPADDDFFGDENEWVIQLNGQKWYFNVDEDGDSGPPSLFHDNDECGSIPMILNLGSTNCGQSTITVNSDIHEDNDSFGNCNYDPSFFGDDDDDQHAQNIVVDFTNGTFTHNHPSGNFVFTFTATCSAASTPAVSVGGFDKVCQTSASDVTFNFAGGTPPYTAEYTINGGSPLTISTSTTTATAAIGTGTPGIYTYEVTQVTDALGCSTQTSSYTVEVTATCDLLVSPKVYLQGPLDMSGATPLMSDALRTSGMIPPMDPYGLGASMGAGLLAATGPDAIVDWVLVEIRDAATNTAVLATAAALLQRDGDVVSPVDGVSPVTVTYSTSGNFHVAVQHRNHLGMMTSVPYPLLPAQN